MKVKPEDKPLGKRILSAMLNFGIANVMTKIIGFLLIPLYTSYLDPADYGIVELCSSLAAFSVIFMRLGVPGSVSRFYFDHKDDVKSLSDYVVTVHRFLMASSLGIGVIIAVITFWFSDVLLPGLLFLPFIGLVLVNSAFSANGDLQKRLLQSKEESAYMAKLNIVTATLSILLALFFVVYMELGALGFILSQSATTLIFYIQAQVYLRTYLKQGSFKPAMLKDSVKYGMGLLPHHLFAVLAPLLSKGILNYKESLAALGLFSLSLRFIQPLDIIYNIFNKAFVPIYFSLRKSNADDQIRRVYTICWYVAIALFSFTAIVLPSVLLLVTPERFHPSASLIPILSIGFMGQLAYSFFMMEKFYDKQTRYVSMVTIFGLVVNLLVTIICVESFGVFAIAYAYSAGFVSWAVAGYFLSGRQFLQYINLQTILIGLVFSIGVFLFTYNIPNENIVARSLFFTGILLVIAFLNLRHIKVLYTSFKKR